jgi:ketosteroid isomerase-like protein
MSSSSEQDKISVVRRYFRLADQGHPEVLDLFHEDAELYFPKFGFASGRQSLFDIVKGFEGALEYLQHDYDTMNIMPAGEYVVVEGTSRGKMLGKTWPGGATSGGRFCNVFRFRDDRISSLHIYLDPDYTGDDEARFRWGKDRKF